MLSSSTEAAASASTEAQKESSPNFKPGDLRSDVHIKEEMGTNDRNGHGGLNDVHVGVVSVASAISVGVEAN
jgi:hypothetical protein